jgi:hypothetical protein
MNFDNSKKKEKSQGTFPWLFFIQIYKGGIINKAKILLSGG